MDLVAVNRKVDKFLGNLLIFLFQPFVRRKERAPKKKRILIIRLWTLGESLLTLPMVKACKDQGYDVTVLVTKRSKRVFERLPFVDTIMDITDWPQLLLKAKHFDYAIDTEPYLNASALLSWFFGKRSIGFGGLYRERMYSHRVPYNDRIHAVYNFCNLLRPLNIRCRPGSLIPMRYDENSAKVMARLLEKNEISGKIVGIHAGTAETAPWRSWSIKKFAGLIENLAENGWTILLTGAPHESARNESIIAEVDEKYHEAIYDFAGRTNLSELAYLMSRIDLFISNDTGPMHLAAAMGTRTIGLFGPNLPVRFKPFGKKNVAIYKAHDMDCSPCINVHKGEFLPCKDAGKCMDAITVEDVLREVEIE